MASPKIRAIIFDIGRVLIRVDVGRAMTDLAENLALSPDEVWSALQNDPRWADWQEGRMSPRDWHAQVVRRLNIPASFEQFTQAWNRALLPQPIQDDAFLEALSKRYKLALLSNTDPIHVAYMESEYDFFRFFPTRIYSCAVGTSKPNPLIFREALKATKATAEETVFIDDMPAYVEAAQRLGIAGITFTSPQKLATDLRNLGVDWESPLPSKKSLKSAPAK